MPKSAIVLASMCLGLTWAMLLTAWHLLNSPAGIAAPNVQGSFSIGLPGGGSQAKGAVNARSALVWDTEAEIIEFEQQGFERYPIASITKIMTAMVALDIGIDWDKEAIIESAEYVVGGQLLLQPEETVTMRDLWHASLMGSANNATLALVRELGVDSKDFVREMNRKAISLKLEQTEFVDVTGLDPRNVSTAYEVARMFEAALREYPEIAEVTGKNEYHFTIGQSGREHMIRNTNKLITEEGIKIRSKTGYLYEAGYCLVVQGDGISRRVVVVLGSPSEWDSRQEIKNLLQSVYGGI